MAAQGGTLLDLGSREFYKGLVDDLIVYAEHAFTLARPTDDGATEGDHRASAARQFAKLRRPIKRDLIPDAPPFPDALEYLWRYFADILNGCGSNGWGPPEITWRDLQAWSEMTGNTIEPWECAALMRLSAVYVRINSAKKSTDKK